MLLLNTQPIPFRFIFLVFQIHCIDQSHDYGHLHVNKLNRVLDQSKQDCLIPTLDKLWRYAQIAELFDENFNVFINLYVPGTMYLNTDYTLRSPSSSWDSKPIKRHLAVVLKFTKHP
ncbi:unnamed protein product [Trichobilharzia regenti]|nr:unnamed protein product [Trichobilharzia regenti]